MLINYIKYLNLQEDQCNKLEFFSGYMDAYERRNDILKLKEKYKDDIYYDGNIGTIEYFNRKELITELNKMNITLDTNHDHVI